MQAGRFDSLAKRALELAIGFGAVFGTCALASPAFFLLSSWVIAPFAWYGVDTRSGESTIFSHAGVWIAASIGLLLTTAFVTAALTRQHSRSLGVFVMPGAYIISAALTHAALWSLGFTSLVE